MIDTLQYLIDAGKIDIADIQEYQEQMRQAKRQELLNKHTFKIYQGKDGNWYTYLSDRKKIKRKSKEAVENVVIEYWKDKADNPTIEEIFHLWNNRKLTVDGIQEATYQRNQQFYNRHYKKFGKQKINTLAPEDFQNFLEEQVSQENLSAKGFAGLKSITKGFLKYAKRNKYISFNVEEMLNDLEITGFKKIVKEDHEEVFDEYEYPRVMNYLCDNIDIYNLGILLMFVTGLRVGELVALRWEDYDGQSLYVRRTETRRTDKDGTYIYEVKDFPKTAAGVRRVIVPSEYLWIMNKLRSFNPFSEYIFSVSNKRIKTYSFRNRLRTICKKTNCYEKSPHKIRKTYGSILCDNHADVRLITDQMGHTDISCTETHYHRNRKSIDTKAQLINSIPEFQIK